MSIAKLRKTALPYNVVCRETIQAICNAAALGLWVYLQSKPDGWTVRPNEVKDHFGIGETRYLGAMRYLRDMGLVETTLERGNKGQILGSTLHVYSSLTETRKTRDTVNPDFGKPGCIKKRDLIQKEKEIPETPGSVGTDAAPRHAAPTPPAWILPPGVDEGVWAEFEQHRREIRKPLSNLSRTKNANVLAKLTPEQQQFSVDNTIANNWTGCFPGKNHAANQRSVQESRADQRAEISRTIADNYARSFPSPEQNSGCIVLEV